MGDGQSLDEAFKQIAALRKTIDEQQRTITRMQSVGGFADSKQLSTRSQRLEDRVERLEFDSVMHQDVTAHTVDLMSRHLHERHDLDLDRDNSPDVIFLRKIRKRLRDWAEDKV
jgi:hypothetical protein